MKIILVSEYFPASEDCEIRGGVEARCFNLAKELSKKHDVLILASREENIKDTQAIDKITIQRIGKRRKYIQSGGFISRLILLFSIIFVKLPFKPDIIDAQAIITYLPTYFLAKRYKTKKVITLHDSWLGRWVSIFGLSGLIGELYERLYLKLSWDGIIANSHYTLNKITHYLKSKKKIVIYNGVRDSKNNEISFIPYTVCVISRLVKYKRVQDVIKAVYLLRKKNLNIQCHIIGSGPEEKKLKNYTCHNHLEENIIFHGFIKKHENAMDILKKSQIFCLLSEVEGFGIVLLESAACGRPYVCSDIPATQEITKNGLGGILYPMGNIESLANSIEKLLVDKKLYFEKSRELKKLINYYHWEDKIKETELFYQSLK